MSTEQLETLKKYTACDVADALLKLEVPGAGFLADIKPIPIPPSAQPATQSPTPATNPIPASTTQDPFTQAPTADPLPLDPSTTPPTLSPPAASSTINAPLSPTPVIARASTLLFVPRSTPSFPSSAGAPIALLNQTFTQPLPNIEPGVPYADLATPGTIAVLSQPRGQKCAVVGGIMAARMRKLGVKGVVVDGRVRDLGGLAEVGAEGWGGCEDVMPIWSKGTSIIGAGAETKAWAVNVPISVDQTEIHPGDVVMMDPASIGAVCIPAKLLDKVLELLPRLAAADEKVLKDVKEGVEVSDAFKRHRGK